MSASPRELLRGMRVAPSILSADFGRLREQVAEVLQAGASVGLATTAATPAAALVEIASALDLALCMTVNPGWAGQAFIEHSIEKIARVRAIVGDGVAVEVDGGIETDTAARSQRAGANVF